MIKEFVQEQKVETKQDNSEKSETPKQNLYLLNKEKARTEAKRKKLERKIEQLENEIKEISLNFEKPEVCCDYVQLMELQKQIDQKHTELEQLTSEWFALSE